MERFFIYVNITGCQNNKDVYIYQSYRKADGKSSSRIFKKLGEYNTLLEQVSVTFSKTTRSSFEEERIKEEAMHDGFYAVITNLEDNPAEIIKINCNTIPFKKARLPITLAKFK